MSHMNLRATKTLMALRAAIKKGGGGRLDVLRQGPWVRVNCKSRKGPHQPDPLSKERRALFDPETIYRDEKEMCLHLD